MAGRPWTDDDTAELRRRHAAQDSLTSIARDLGFAPSTVSKRAAALGLTWDTTPIREATAARRDRLKAARADIIDRLYGRALHTLDRLESETFSTLTKGSFGVEEPTKLKFVPPQDEKALVQAIGTTISAAARLEQVDSGADVDAARSMLGKLGDALKAAAGDPPPTE